MRGQFAISILILNLTWFAVAHAAASTSSELSQKFVQVDTVFARYLATEHSGSKHATSKKAATLQLLIKERREMCAIDISTCLQLTTIQGGLCSDGTVETKSIRYQLWETMFKNLNQEQMKIFSQSVVACSKVPTEGQFYALLKLLTRASQDRNSELAISLAETIAKRWTRPPKAIENYLQMTVTTLNELERVKPMLVKPTKMLLVTSVNWSLDPSSRFAFKLPKQKILDWFAQVLELSWLSDYSHFMNLITKYPALIRTGSTTQRLKAVSGYCAYLWSHGHSEICAKELTLLKDSQNGKDREFKTQIELQEAKNDHYKGDDEAALQKLKAIRNKVPRLSPTMAAWVSYSMALTESSLGLLKEAQTHADEFSIAMKSQSQIMLRIFGENLEALIRIENGDYTAALEKIRTIRRMLREIVDDDVDLDGWLYYCEVYLFVQKGDRTAAEAAYVKLQAHVQDFPLHEFIGLLAKSFLDAGKGLLAAEDIALAKKSLGNSADPDIRRAERLLVRLQSNSSK